MMSLACSVLFHCCKFSPALTLTNLLQLVNRLNRGHIKSHGTTALFYEAIKVRGLASNVHSKATKMVRPFQNDLFGSALMNQKFYLS